MLRMPPINDIASYFGSKIGLYFGWMQHYIFSLAIHVTVGVLFWSFQQMTQHTVGKEIDSSYTDITFLLFSMFNVIWTIFYLKSWDRRSTELTYTWKTLNAEKELLCEARPLFRGEEIINEITGQPELYYPAWKRTMFRSLVSVPVISLFLVACFITVIVSFQIQEWWDKEIGYFCFVPKVFLATSIPILNFLYENIATLLNDLENHRSEEDHNNNLSLKLILFQFINSFLSLFYVAFYLKDMETLRSLLTTILVTRQITRNLTETIIPFATKQVQLLLTAFRNNIPSNLEEASKTMADITQVERESSSPKYKGTHGEYIEIRGDALTLCIAYQRPFGERVANIGVWKITMECMGVIAIIVNFALIGQCGQIKTWLPDMDETNIIILIVGIEHFLLLSKIVISYAISNMPNWVEDELINVEHKRREHEKRKLSTWRNH